MPSVFKSIYPASTIGTVNTIVYTVPALTTAIVTNLTIANIVNSVIHITVRSFKASVPTTRFIISASPVPVGSSLVVIGDKTQRFILQAGDDIEVQSDTLVSADVTMGVLEIT